MKFMSKKKENFDYTILNNSKNKKTDIDNILIEKLDVSKELLVFIKKHVTLDSDSTYITATSTIFNINNLKRKKYHSIVNFKKINDARYINKFFEAVNDILPDYGLYFGKVETYPNRRKALLDKYPLIINWVIYIFDMIFTRIFPKLPITKKLYFYFTKGKGRVVSRAEIYGRLYSCGFEIVDEKTFNNHLYFIFKKIKDPFFDKNPTYGPIINLKRVGLNGKLINVYKIRTMHPFSEYLQEYIFNQNKLQKGGKIKNDFRISPEGRILRIFWIDELPMIINILKGEMKLVGVRPLSEHFYSLYDKDLQQKRIKNKPGFIPPYYVDLPETMDEIMESERKYLELYDQSPFMTDVKYFFLAFKNVLFKGVRSK